MKFATGNSPRWNEFWNRGYQDCADPERGRLIKCPDSWHPMLWEAYEDGCYWFDSDTRSIQDARS